VSQKRCQALDRFGRILLPQPLRQQLRLRPGDEIELQLVDQQIILRRKAAEPSAVQYQDGIPVVDVPVEEIQMKRFI
jgi:AbrB family looped-hinge helix DNA binding protein